MRAKQLRWVEREKIIKAITSVVHFHIHKDRCALYVKYVDHESIYHFESVEQAKEKANLIYKEIVLENVYSRDLVDKAVDKDKEFDRANRIMEMVLTGCNVRYDQFVSKVRKREFVWPRQIFSYLCYHFSRLSCEEISSLMKKDHATVYHGMRTVNNLRETDAGINQEVQTYIDQIRDL